MSLRRTLLLLAALASGCASASAADFAAAILPPVVRASPQDYLVVTVSNSHRLSALRAGATPHGYSGQPYGVTAVAAARLRGLEHDYHLQQVSAWPISTLSVHCAVFRLPETASRQRIIASLERDSRVDSVQPLQVFAMRTTPEPAPPAGWMPYNDPYGSLQHSLRELAVIDAQRLSRGDGIRIAVIDTGIDFLHPDLKDRVLMRRNFVDADERAFRADRHGTEVGGVIAALADNGVGIVGVAPGARLLALKACWEPASGDGTAVCNSFTLAQAVEAAILARADIVNMSLSGPPDPLLARLIRAGMERGILFVGAVAPDETRGFPAELDGVIAVSMAESRQPADALHAPGRDVLTLVPDGHYDFASGSSLATAEVTGVIALVLARHPRLSAAELRSILKRSEVSTVGVRGRMCSIDACQALTLARGQPACHQDGIGAAQHPPASAVVDGCMTNTTAETADPRRAPTPSP